MDTADLVHPDSRRFETSFVELRQSLEQKSAIQGLVQILEVFDGDQGLSEREKGRRIALIVEAWKPKGKDLTTIARQANALSATTRNALLGYFPPELQQEVYKSSVETSSQLSNDAGGKIVDDSYSSVVGDSAAADTAMETDLTFESEEGQEPSAEDKIVLLLGAAEKHEANILFLKANHFEPLRAGSPKDRDELLGNPICGIVVDGSWWTLFPSEQHAEELKKILAYSTFVFVRIDPAGLNDEAAKRMSTFAREIKFREPLATECQWGASRINVNDISDLTQAASLLSTNQRCRFHPSEIDEAEGVILLAAVKRKVKNRHPLNGLEIERVATSLLAEGQTNARMFVLKPNDRGAPFVAKLDSVGQLRDEMARFARFISHRENWLKPELHIHGNIGMILFSLVDDVNQRDVPAPTLATCLRDLSAIDRGLDSANAPSASDLATAVRRTVAKLVELNSDPCNPFGVTNSCWLGIEPLYRMKEKGVTYSIKGSTGTLDLIELAERAIKKIEKLNGKATVHGDVHVRNVLIRDREPFLIDYAYTGPGHPCFDLVRFESSLVFSNLRMTADEDELEACFRQVFIDGRGPAEISSAFPLICSSAVTTVSLEAAMYARAAAIEMSSKYGGDANDYLAVKFVVACQALTMPEPQSGVVRGLLRALAPLVERL